jgi:hypothetical protein
MTSKSFASCYSERRPRSIVDYSFSNINADTVHLCPRESMQFGRTLERLLTQIVHSDPRFGPVQLLKLDIKDGFYRVWVRPEDIPKLGIALPVLAGEPPQVAFPLALPMGWTESPPAFRAATETIPDIANLHLAHRRPALPHRLELVADSCTPQDRVALPATPAFVTVSPLPQPNPLLAHHHHRLAAIDVFVDDFIAAAQEGGGARRQYVRRVLMNSVDLIFRPLSPTGDPTSHRTEPISVTKLRQGEGAWSTCKKVLG